jgi:membrane associated rhomboid family serine protease
MDLKSKIKPPTRAVHSIREELIGVVVFIAIIWAVFFLDWFLPLRERFALVPRSLVGLTGIVSMTFLHRDLPHIWSNTIPLFVLLTLLAGSRASSWKIVLSIGLIGGGLLWLFGNLPPELAALVVGRSGNFETRHIGASLLVFGLITFLVSSGYFERRPIPVMIAAFVGFMYGLTFLWGIIPSPGSKVSWEGHLFGGIAGILVAYGLARGPKSPAKRSRL